jgi:hypothetical protein
MKALLCTLITVATIVISTTVTAADTLSTKTGILKIQSLSINGKKYLNVSIKLNQDGYTLLKSTRASTLCNKAKNLSQVQYNSVNDDMTMDQVLEVIGCNYNDVMTRQHTDSYTDTIYTIYRWTDNKNNYIEVSFNNTTMLAGYTDNGLIYNPVCRYDSSNKFFFGCPW